MVDVPGGDERPLELGGILLTHAHTGHYTGLLQLGKEEADTRGVPVREVGHRSGCAQDVIAAKWAVLLLDKGHVMVAGFTTNQTFDRR